MTNLDFGSMSGKATWRNPIAPLMSSSHALILRDWLEHGVVPATNTIAIAREVRILARLRTERKSRVTNSITTFIVSIVRVTSRPDRSYFNATVTHFRLD